MVSQDPLMWGWLAFWVPSYIVRRWQAVRLTRSGQVHSWDDGYPKGLSKIWGRFARKVEVIYMGLIGAGFYWLYDKAGMPQGISWFFLFGVSTLPFCDWVRNSLSERRVQAMVNSRIENAGMVDMYRERIGE